MKIKKLSCTQFAGVRDRDISFTDGVNVICGKNESGKSTMVNLLSRTLFQNAKIDGRKDKEFCALYFRAAAGAAISRVTLPTARSHLKRSTEAIHSPKNGARMPAAHW